jgi:hypothetical protein
MCTPYQGLLLDCLYLLFLLIKYYILTWECCIFKEADGKPIINHVTVFERPGLKEFLRQLSEFADLVLFTAGLEGLIFYFSCCIFIFIFLCMQLQRLVRPKWTTNSP